MWGACGGCQWWCRGAHVPHTPLQTAPHGSMRPHACDSCRHAAYDAEPLPLPACGPCRHAAHHARSACMCCATASTASCSPSSGLSHTMPSACCMLESWGHWRGVCRWSLQRRAAETSGARGTRAAGRCAGSHKAPRAAGPKRSAWRDRARTASMIRRWAAAAASASSSVSLGAGPPPAAHCSCSAGEGGRLTILPPHLPGRGAMSTATGVPLPPLPLSQVGRLWAQPISAAAAAAGSRPCLVRQLWQHALGCAWHQGGAPSGKPSRTRFGLHAAPGG